MSRSSSLLDSNGEEVSGLGPLEIFWRERQPWLEERGYMLRPRYKPGWVGSWVGTNKDPWNCEDGVSDSVGVVIDAIRSRDNADVCLKRIKMDVHEHEVAIAIYLSSDPLARDPRNRCVSILETLNYPGDVNIAIIVMPLLRAYLEPRFDTFGEAVDFFGQIFEGLKFMHDHNVAHRDCKSDNILMDASEMYPDGFHPVETKRKRNFSGRVKFYNRTQRPPKYYYIDFGLSRRYETRNPPPLEPIIMGGYKNVPEFRFTEDGEPPEDCDPFPTDVFCLGNMICADFLQGDKSNEYKNKLYGFEFMKPLVDDMVSEDPATRPTMDEVVERFAAIRSTLGAWKLRSRVVKASDWFPMDFPRTVRHWYRRVGYVLTRTPAIPVLKFS
ncbi:kinase-like domain-containing protein [Mycena galericulata]|nr:kinase-like domain-containing protein [Mycena galericulata]